MKRDLHVAGVGDWNTYGVYEELIWEKPKLLSTHKTLNEACKEIERLEKLDYDNARKSG